MGSGDVYKRQERMAAAVELVQETIAAERRKKERRQAEQAQRNES